MEKQNNAKALWELGNQNYNNKKTAFIYWKKASKLGYTDAYHDLGLCYQNGEGVCKNISKAIQCYKICIQAGNHQAITNLGYIYETIKKDYVKARELYEQAMQHNESMAINNLANLYNNGLGVKKDVTKAITYFTQASDMGNKNATINLLYHYAKICDTNNATKYFKRLEAIDKHAQELDDYINLLYKRATNDASKSELYHHLADLGCKKATEHLLDYNAKNCTIADKYVIIGVGCGATNILHELSLNKLSKNCVTVAIHNIHCFNNYPANINIHLKAEYGANYHSINNKEFAKISDFIDCKLDKSKKIIIVGHGGGDSQQIFKLVVSKIKKRGHDFKVIMPTPFFWEHKKRLDLTKKIIKHFKNAKINPILIDYNQIYKDPSIDTISKSFTTANHLVIEQIYRFLL